MEISNYSAAVPHPDGEKKIYIPHWERKKMTKQVKICLGKQTQEGDNPKVRIYSQRRDIAEAKK